MNRSQQIRALEPSFSESPAARIPTAATLVHALLATGPDRAAAFARVALGALLLPHGLQHAIGLLGGHGFAGTLAWMTGTLGFPAPAAALAIVTELLAPLALLLGLGSRLAALGLFGLMAGALSTHVGNGFFMNWFGSLPAGAEGFEYHLLVMAIAVLVVVRGGGWASIDGWLARRLNPGPA